jgi:hypothetical protein
LQTRIPAARFPRFADIRGNGHFHACGDAIRGANRNEDVRPDGIRYPLAMYLFRAQNSYAEPRGPS